MNMRIKSSFFINVSILTDIIEEKGHEKEKRFVAFSSSLKLDFTLEQICFFPQI